LFLSDFDGLAETPAAAAWLFNLARYNSFMPERAAKPDEQTDPWIEKFLQHLSTDRGASTYTQRNYEQTLNAFCQWHQTERQQPPSWNNLGRDDFRGFLRFLGRNNLSRATIQLRFSALRTFYKFLAQRHGLKDNPLKQVQPRECFGPLHTRLAEISTTEHEGFSF